MNKKPKAVRLKAFWPSALVHCMSGKSILFYDKKGRACMLVGKVGFTHVLLNELHPLGKCHLRGCGHIMSST